MKPPVVIDKNIFQGWAHDYLPKDRQSVIPDRLFFEILTDEKRDLAPKLLRHLKMDVDAFCIARSPGNLIELDSSPTEELHNEAYIDLDLTILAREALSDPYDVLLQRVQDARGSKELASTEHDRISILMDCDLAASDIGLIEDDLKQLSSGNAINIEELESHVCDPDALSPFLECESGYATDEWRNQLLVFPDTKAVGRWWRLNLYLWLLRLNNRSDKYMNSVDDMYYAFLASYVGAIATEDKGLTKTIELLFPSVEIHTHI